MDDSMQRMRSRRVVMRIVVGVMLGALGLAALRDTIGQTAPPVSSLWENEDDCRAFSAVLNDPAISSLMQSQFQLQAPCGGRLMRRAYSTTVYHGSFRFGDSSSASIQLDYIFMLPDRLKHAIRRTGPSTFRDDPLFIFDYDCCRVLGHVLANLPSEVLDRFSSGQVVSRAWAVPSAHSFVPDYAVVFRFSSGIADTYLTVSATYDGTTFGPLRVE